MPKGLPLAMELAEPPSALVPASSQADFGPPELFSVCSSLELELWLVGWRRLMQSVVEFSIKLLVIDFRVNSVGWRQLVGGLFVITIALPTWRPSVAANIITSLPFIIELIDLVAFMVAAAFIPLVERIALARIIRREMATLGIGLERSSGAFGRGAPACYFGPSFVLGQPGGASVAFA